MKKAVFFSSFALVAATASLSFADYYPATHWRCQADPLVGHPSYTMESRTGYGRKTWAYDAFKHWKFTVGNGAIANRFWESWMNQEVADAALVDLDLYPVYANDDTAAMWIGPGPNAAATWKGSTFSTIKDRPYTLPGAPATPIDTTTTKMRVEALCEAGCYTPEQEVRFGGAFAPIANAYESGQREVTTLAPNASFNALNFIVNDIARWTVDIAPADQTIITLRMESGGELRVTTEHPVLTSEGVMKKAIDLVVGESLVREDGSPDPIETIEQKTVFTKAYNLRPVTTDLTSNILVAQGYLNGSARYQSEYLKYLNRVLLRKRVPTELIPRGRMAKVQGKVRGTSTPTELKVSAPEPRHR